ncbi:hypothetical protein [Maribellus sp. YY47]|uniref:hypothetical protein n=1 Tax=Maribellus sp. YY47 TaxID=2929486 RepID=UPI002001BFD1|nr:hypothetical protein [Maribellus sp. YY47]MCK3685018.1 hypothetical protein [Maribellus sp. YY47]
MIYRLIPPTISALFYYVIILINPYFKKGVTYIYDFQNSLDLISFGTKYWFIHLLAVLAAALGIVILLYFKNKANSELSKIQIRILSALRFVSFFLIAVLLLAPFLRSLKKISQNPLIIAAWDNSSSMISGPDSTALSTEIKALKKELNDKLGNDFELVNYNFGEEPGTKDELSFNAKRSNYSEMLNTVSNNHFNQNIGALILVGDGIYNQGRNPVNQLSDINFPVYTIGFGDTTIVADSRIQNIRVNRTAFSGNKFPVEVDVHFSKVRNKVLKLSVVKGNEELQSVMITPPNDNYFISREFILDADQTGLQHYTAKIETVENEQNTKNNSAGFVINVLENKQKILILSDGSHPDIGAIKYTLEEQKTYDVSVFTAEPYPSNLNDYNLIILNQLPTSGKSIAQVIENAQAGRLPVLFIVGSKTFLPQLNTFDQGAKITPLAGSGEEAQPVFNPIYATFRLSEDFLEVLPKFPPLNVAYADYELDADFTTLLYQKLKNIETGKPLMATGKKNGRKVGFIFGEGIWRWRLFDYYQNQSHDRFNELINQLIQYLALRENEDNFIVEFQPVYSETDDVILNAEVYNDAFERITTGEVNITLKNFDNEDFNFTFDVQGEDYFLNAGHLPLGDYTFDAKVDIGTEEYNETGSFTVVPVNLEDVVTRADHNTLYQLASLSGGKFYLPASAGQLIDELKSGNKPKTVNYYQEMVNELLNFKWLFFVLLLILSVEWFLRKYWGVY